MMWGRKSKKSFICHQKIMKKYILCYTKTKATTLTLQITENLLFHQTRAKNTDFEMKHHEKKLFHQTKANSNDFGTRNHQKQNDVIRTVQKAPDNSSTGKL